MLSVTIADYAQALSLTRERVGVVLSGLPHTRPSGHTRRYTLPAVLPTVRDKYRNRVPQLLDLARDDGELFCGDDSAVPQAEALCEWIERDPEMKERLRRVRLTFFSALAGATRSSIFMGDVERVRLMLPLSQHILPFLLTGRGGELPDFSAFSRAFTLVHQAPPYTSEIVRAAA